MPATYRHIVYIRFPYLAASRVRRTDRGNAPFVIIQQTRGVDIVAATCAKAAKQGL